jgi:type 1 fimbria pilin
VDDLLHQATDVTVALGKVESTELGGTDTVVGVGLEDTSGFTLVANDCNRD